MPAQLDMESRRHDDPTNCLEALMSILPHAPALPMSPARHLIDLVEAVVKMARADLTRPGEPEAQPDGRFLELACWKEGSEDAS